MAKMKEILIEIETLYASGASVQEISESVGISESMVKEIIDDWFVVFEQHSE